MADKDFVIKNGLVVNTVFSANSSGMYFSNTLTVNSTVFVGTSNNTTYVGSVSAANVVSNAQLSSNLANYTNTAGLISYVAGTTANNTSFVGSVSAANVVSNAQLSSNLANYTTTSALSSNLSNYQTTAGLSANVATLTANNATYAYGKTEGNLSVNYATSAGSATNATTATNQSGGTVSATTGSFSGNMSFNSGYGSSAVAYGTRAWVQFYYSGGVATRGSGGVSSVSYAGSSVFTTNFSVTMPSSGYATTAYSRDNNDDAMGVLVGGVGSEGYGTTYKNVRVYAMDPGELSLAFTR